MNDIVINKIQSVQRCVERAREEYGSAPEEFETNYTAQDAVTLNILRACEQAIDLANHLIRAGKMGIPTSSAESFDLLQARGVIDRELAEKLKRMVHFRNIAVHQYERLDMEVLRSVIVSDLDHIVEFGDHAREFFSGPPS